MKSQNRNPLLIPLAVCLGVLASVFRAPAPNVVGYINVPVQKGRYHAIGNQLLASPNELLNTVLPGQPSTLNGTRFFSWDQTGYVTPPSELTDGIWSPNVLFPVGRESMIKPTTNHTFTFVGDVLTRSTNIFPAGYSLRCSIFPQAGSLDDLALTSVLPPGDGVLRWNFPAQKWTPHLYRGAGTGWTPATPTVDVAESFFIVSATGGQWIRNVILRPAPADGSQSIPGLGVTLLPEDPQEREAVLRSLREAIAASDSGPLNDPPPPPASDPPPPLGYVIFANRFGPLDATIANTAGQPCAGTNYVAALQYSDDGVNWVWTESPVAPVNFSSSLAPGYFFGGAKTVPRTGPTWLRLHVWTAGLTWEQAQSASGAESGTSVPMQLDLPSAAGDSPVPPPLLAGLKPFQLQTAGAQLGILAQPQSRTNVVGSTAEFTVSGSGTPTPTYQWFFQGLLLNSETGTSLVISNVNTSHAGNYQVVLTSGSISTTSAVAELIVVPASLGAVSLVGVRSPDALELNWPPDHTGWRLETQNTSLAAGLGTNWLTVPGSSLTNRITLPLAPAPGGSYFRLVYP